MWKRRNSAGSRVLAQAVAPVPPGAGVGPWGVLEVLLAWHLVVALAAEAPQRGVVSHVPPTWEALQEDAEASCLGAKLHLNMSTTSPFPRPPPQMVLVNMMECVYESMQILATLVTALSNYNFKKLV